MGKRKLKITFVITGIFLVCFVISFFVSDIIKNSESKADLAGTEVISDNQTEDTIQMGNSEEIAAQAPDASSMTDDAAAEDTDSVSKESAVNTDVAANETASQDITGTKDVTEVQNTKAGAGTETTISIDQSSTDTTKTEAALEAAQNTITDDNDSDLIETTEDSYTTSDTDTEGLIGILSTPEWYEAIDVAPTCDYVIANVNEMLNVRAEPDKNSELVGKLAKDSYAKILERGEEWTKIESGNVTGYVYNTYLYMDEAALERFKELDAYKVEVNVNVLNIRTEPNTDCEVLGKATTGDEFTYLEESSVEDWNAIQYDDETIAYVSAEYCDVEITLDTAMTIDEYNAALKAAALSKALEESKKTKPSVINRDPIELSDEDIYLMSVVIAMEALNESHEGKVAVANVIINRMLNGYWGDTISDVVYAPGQFTGANSGRVELYWNKVSKDCMDAAVEALAGYNNIGDYLFFISIGKANFDDYSKYYVLNGHCFYSRKW